MSTNRRIDVICIVIVLLTIVLTALLMGGKVTGLVPVMSQTGSTYFTVNDLNADWDTAAATKIQLSDKGSIITGNGAYENDGTVYIAYAGDYVLTGALTNGNIVIDADKSDQIRILLDGVTLYKENDAAIRVEQAGHVYLTLADGTESVISSGEEYDETLVDSGVDGTIYSRDDLTINGSGGLSVSGAYNHGIVCNDDLVIAGGRLTIDAVQDGIHANDSVRIREAEISVSAGDDGITVSNDDETAYFYMESGSVSIPDCYEGIEAIDITIAGGIFDIMPTDDGINANGSGEDSVIRITGGDIVIENPSGRDADGLDSNGSIYIEGGKVFISVAEGGGNCALDYGTENGGECVVNGGTVIACGGSMMAEGFDSSSGQGFLMYQTSAEGGTTLRLTDAEGEELLSEEIPCSFSLAVLSAPGLKVGDVCTIAVGDTEEEVTIDNASNSGIGPAGMPGMHGGGGMRGGKDRFGQSDEQGMDGEDRFGQPDEQGMDGEDRFGQPDEQGMNGEDRFGQSGEQGMNGEERFGQSGERGMDGENRSEQSGDRDMGSAQNAEAEGKSGESEDTVPADKMVEPDVDDASISGEGNADPEKTEAPDGRKLHDGMEPPDGMERPDRMDVSDETELPGDMKPSDRADFRKEGQGQMRSEEAEAGTGVSVAALVLVGISAAVLLVGLGIAIKIEH